MVIHAARYLTIDQGFNDILYLKANQKKARHQFHDLFSSCKVNKNVTTPSYKIMLHYLLSQIIFTCIFHILYIYLITLFENSLLLSIL